jgi:ketosteroid isomerase-like protein
MPLRRATAAVVIPVALLAALACARASSSSTTAGASTASTARGCPPAGDTAATGRVIGQVAGRAQVGAASTASSSPPVRDPQVALRQICAMMNASARRWNAGDLHGFMQDYMPGEGTTYIGRRDVVRGPEAIEAHYAPRFQPGAMHDSLSFEDVEVDLLAPDLTNTIAWYVLMRGDSLVARGPTSLVMRRVNGHWRIVHDHSS